MAPCDGTRLADWLAHFETALPACAPESLPLIVRLAAKLRSCRWCCVAYRGGGSRASRWKLSKQKKRSGDRDGVVTCGSCILDWKEKFHTVSVKLCNTGKKLLHRPNILKMLLKRENTVACRALQVSVSPVDDQVLAKASAKLESSWFVFVNDATYKAILETNLLPSALKISPNSGFKAGRCSIAHSQVRQGVDQGSPDQEPMMAIPISKPELF